MTEAVDTAEVFEFDASAVDVVLAGNAVVILSSSFLAALDVATGEFVWDVDVPGGTQGTECLEVTDSAVVIVRDGQRVGAHGLDSGEMVALDAVGVVVQPCHQNPQRIDGSPITGSPMVVGDQQVLDVVNDDTHVAAVDGYIVVNDFDAGFAVYDRVSGANVMRQPPGDPMFDPSPIATSAEFAASVMSDGRLVVWPVPSR